MDQKRGRALDKCAITHHQGDIVGHIVGFLGMQGHERENERERRERER